MNDDPSKCDDPFDLQRFLDAQRGVYDRALAEIQRGRKRSHWMWYIFPQIQGLGRSATAQRYAIQSPEEAQQYLAHPVLGARLRECVWALLALEGSSASEIFGYPDVLKLRSSLTLFAQVDEQEEAIFVATLDKYYQGQHDERTLEILAQLEKAQS
jgi:uncharacterized protein (DUF1810 family)